jgi:fibronectin-binding autotransporter adhesin
MRLRYHSLLWVGVVAVWLGCVPMASAQLVTATLTSTGNWNDPIRWDTNPLFPNNGNGGNNYNVNIGSSRTATLTDVDITIEGLVFNTGTINGNRNLTMNAASTWSAGTIAGTGTIQFNDTLAVNTNSAKTLGNANFRTAGTTTWTGTANITGTGGTWTNLSGALFDAQNNQSFAVTSGVNTFNNESGATFRKSVGTGTTTVNWAFNNGGTINVQTGTLSLSGGGTSTNGTFVIATGAILNPTTAYNFSGTHTGTGGGQFRQTLNITAAAGGITLDFVDGLYRWNGGTLNGGTVTNAATGFITLDTTASKTLGTVFENNGTVRHTNTGSLAGASGTFNNNSGALYDLQNDGDITTASGTNTFNNNVGATFRKSGGTATSNITWIFNHQGDVEVQTGTLTFGGGGTATNALWNISTGAVVNPTAAYNFSGTQTGTGGGQFRQTLNITAAAGGITLDFVDGLYRWNGGTLNGGTVTNAATGFITLDTTASKTLGTVFENNGTVRHTNTGSLVGASGTFNNNSGALYDLQNDGDILVASGTNTFNNNVGATFRKSGGTATSNITWTLNNSGTIEGNAGVLSINSTFSQTASGTLSVNSGTIRFGATGTAVVNLQGNMVGSGTIDPGTINHSNGTIAPGLSVGTLTIAGNLVMAATSVLNFELGTSSDLLIVNGNLTLDGVLNVTDSGGFVPGVYTIIDYSGTLTDNGLNLGSLPGEFAYAIVNDPVNTRIQLVVTSVPEPAMLGVFGMLATGGFAVWARRKEEQQQHRRSAA